MRYRSLSIFIVAVVCTGCGSILSRMNVDPGPGYTIRNYPGVRMDVCAITSPHAEPRALWICYGILDIPFTAVVDTLLLPIDLQDRTGSGQRSDVIYTNP
jgi:uncharacterized protein YceK